MGWKLYPECVLVPPGYTPPRNWVLDQTSSWVNYFLGRDHRGER
jgi:hypothetical protein